jgi:ABC-type amino acid transport substrate-binding protein
MSPQIRVLIFRSKLSAVVIAILLFSLAGCASKPKAPEAAASAPNQQPTAVPTSAALETTDADTAQQTTALALPKNFGRFTGDWDAIVKRGALRVLTVYNKSGFFYDHGGPRGAVVEAMEEFANVTNQKLKTGAKKFKVAYLPMPPGQLQAALNDGIGDIACTAILITPERQLDNCTRFLYIQSPLIDMPATNRALRRNSSCNATTNNANHRKFLIR